jgi:hypothetical protein
VSPRFVCTLLLAAFLTAVGCGQSSSTQPNASQPPAKGSPKDVTKGNRVGWEPQNKGPDKRTPRE